MLISEVEKKKLPEMIAKGVTEILQSENIPFTTLTCGYSDDWKKIIVHITDQHNKMYHVEAIYERVKGLDLNSSNLGLAHNIIEHVFS